MSFAQVCAGVCCVLVLVPAVVLLGLSFSTLHATEWGLNYNSITKSIRPEVYTAGLHMIGPGHSFIRFPNTYQNMQFSTNDNDLLHTRTSDGLPLTLGVSFQYTLRQSELYTLYFKYKEEYNHVLFNVATHIIANTACNYTAYNFFNDKQSIAYAMQDSLNKYVTENLHLSVETLQIILVQLPASFEDAILESISVKQNITRTKKYLDTQKVTFQTQVMAAQQAANQTVTLAEGRSQQIQAEQAASASALRQNVAAETLSYARIRDSLNLANKELIEYVWWDSMTDQQSSSQMIVDMSPSYQITK